MINALVKLSHKFPKHGWPCRYDFWLWIAILAILLFNAFVSIF